jgi:Ser/Thr protein kinase RdoA (MazF antagonist)
MNLRHDVASVARKFRLYGDFIRAEPYGNGHINDTYCAVFDQGGAPVRYILQRLNQNVFKEPAALMKNVERVTRHLAQKLDGASSRQTLTLLPSGDGSSFHIDGDGNFWRAYIFIENAATHETIQSPAQAFQAARAFGRFQQLLADLPSPRLHDSIPDFHNTPQRFSRFEASVEKDRFCRAASARSEIEFALSRSGVCGLLVNAGLPERVTHNDTKINNVMLDNATGEGICVIDLDTVMPGLAPYDFGDLVRTATSPAAEDEKDLSRVRMRFEMFEALLRGYLESAGGFLTAMEKQMLPAAGKVITFEIGIRFLTDYLEGDVYFKTHREAHNLERCRAQFALLRSIENQESEMHKLVESLESVAV